ATRPARVDPKSLPNPERLVHQETVFRRFPVSPHHWSTFLPKAELRRSAEFAAPAGLTVPRSAEFSTPVSRSRPPRSGHLAPGPVTGIGVASKPPGGNRPGILPRLPPRSRKKPLPPRVPPPGCTTAPARTKAGGGFARGVNVLACGGDGENGRGSWPSMG